MITDRTPRESEYIDQIIEVIGDLKQRLEDKAAREGKTRVYWKDVAELLQVSASSISRTNNRNVPDCVVEALQKHALLGKRPPKDPRQRVWMRTDSITLALLTIREHYPDYTIRAVKKQAMLVSYPKGTIWD